MVMLEGVSPETAPLVWDANARAFRPARANAEPAVRYFIKGPLPLPWLHRAAALPGKALHIAVGLWYMRGLCRSASFPFKRKTAAEFSVSRDATYDALTNLEDAGLIRVNRHRGRSPMVTVLDLVD